MTIELTNPFFEEYIKNVGKEDLEKMFISFLKIKSKQNIYDKKEVDNIEKAREFGISLKVHKKILSLKGNNSKKSQNMSKLREEISKKVQDKYKNKSLAEIREEYFDSKEY